MRVILYLFAGLGAVVIGVLWRMDVVDEAAWLEQAEREAGVRRVREALFGPGDDACAGCGEQIDAKRRAALPSADRCTPCQAAIEAQARSRSGRAFLGDGA